MPRAEAILRTPAARDLLFWPILEDGVWIQRYPGSPLYSGFLDLLEVLPRRLLVAEVGAYTGEATVLLSLVAQRVWAIDLWAEPEIERQFDLRIAPYVRAGVEIEKLRLSSIQAAAGFPDKLFDLVYVDADHEYASVREDLVAWKPKVRPGGLIGGHDYRTTWPGVDRAVEEILGPPKQLFADSSWLVQL
jgi:hypothetical protein